MRIAYVCADPGVPVFGAKGASVNVQGVLGALLRARADGKRIRTAGENQREVNDALRRLSQGRTTVIVAHDLRSVERADQILYVEAGEIVERGTHAELMEQDATYATVYRLQSAERPAERAEPGDRLAARPTWS
jgi:hypothetical protein